MSIIINKEESCFVRNGLKIYYEDNYRLSNGDECDIEDNIYTSFSNTDELTEDHDIVDIIKIYELIEYINRRSKIQIENYKGEKYYLPGNNFIDFDFDDDIKDAFYLTRGYVYILIQNAIYSKDKILINYMDLNGLDEIMDIYTNVFNSRTLQMKFVD